MDRKSIFELLYSRFDIKTEIMRIEVLLTQVNSIQIGGRLNNFQACVDEYCFKKWKNRNGCLSCQDMRIQLGIESILTQKNLTVKDALIYVEYVVNMIYLCEKLSKRMNCYFKDSYYVLNENIIGVLNRINYEIIYYEDKEMARVIEKNPAATAVADVVDDETAFKVIEYNHYLMKGDLNRKREILIALGDKFEPIRAALKANGYSSIEDDASFMLNNLNIRHNNLDGKYKKDFTASMTSEQLEEWYDKTYDVLLLSLLTNNYVDLHSDITALKANY
jgi:hypothetical protein